MGYLPLRSLKGPEVRRMKWVSAKAAKLPDDSRPWRSLLSRTGLFFSLFGGSVLLCGVTGMNWGMSYTQEKLAPQVAQLLSQTLDRPVHLGPIQQVFPTGLRLGASAIPPTETDGDQITAEAVDVQFNVWQILSQGKLGLTVTLIRPRIVLDQNETGQWIEADLALDDEEQVELSQIRLHDATVELMSMPKALRSLADNPEARRISIAPPQVTVQEVDLEVTLPGSDHQPVRFKATGQPQAGGEFWVQGQARLEDQSATLQLRTNQLAVTALNPVLPPTARLDAGRLSSHLQIQIQPQIQPGSEFNLEAIALKGTGEIEGLAAQVDSEPNLFTQTNSRFRCQGQHIILEETRLAYGQIPFEDISGTIHLREGFNLSGKVHSVPVVAVMDTFDLHVPFPINGTLHTENLQVTGPLDSAIFSGMVRDADPIQVDRLEVASFNAAFVYDTGPDRLLIHDAEAVPLVGGLVTGEGEFILGEADQGEPDDVALKIQVKAIPGQAIAQLYKTPISAFTLGHINANASILVHNEHPQMHLNWTLSQGTYPAAGKVVLDGETLHLQDTQIQVATQTIQAEGEVNRDRWQLAVHGEGIPLQGVFPDATRQADGTVAIRGKVTGTVDRPIESAQGELQALVEVADETVQAKGQIAQGRWQASVSGQGIPLDRLSATFPGALAADVQLSGSLTNLTPEAIQAKGQLHLSEGISQQMALLNQPWVASFDWDGDRMNIHQASTTGLDVTGWASAKFDGWTRPTITHVDLEMQLQRYDLATLPWLDALPVRLQGLADFNGRLTGTPIAPNLDGKLRLHQLAVEQFAFDPLLTGDVQFAPDQGIRLQVASEQDHVALVLDNRYRLHTFSLQIDQAIARITSHPTINPANPYRLLATLHNIPLERFNLKPVATPDLGIIGGALSGQFDIDWTDPSNPRAIGQVTVLQPTLGGPHDSLPIHSQQHHFTGKLSYGDRTLDLTDGELQLGLSRYRLTGQLRSGNSPHISGQLVTDSGNLQDLLTFLPPQQWHALLSALDAPNWLPSSSSPATPLLSTQSTLRSLIPAASPLQLPAWSELQGQFSTAITFQHSPHSGLVAAFDFYGQHWNWGHYGIEQIAIAQGQFDGEHLALPSATLQGLSYHPPDQPHQAVDAQLTFSGSLGKQQAGELQVENIPMAFLARLFNIPIPMTGDLQARATLAGSLTAPQITGSVNAMNLRLNTREIEDLQVIFSYYDNQFHIDDWLLIAP